MGFAAADMDGDEDLDIAASYFYKMGIAVWKNNNGVFSATPEIITMDTGISSIFIKDMDGDGDADIVSASEDENEISIWNSN